MTDTLPPVQLSLPAQKALQEADTMAWAILETMRTEMSLAGREREVRVLFGLLHKAVQTVRAIAKCAFERCPDEAHALLRPLLETAAILDALTEPRGGHTRPGILDRYICYAEVQVGRWIDQFADATPDDRADAHAVQMALDFRHARPVRDDDAKKRVGEELFERFARNGSWFPHPTDKSRAVGLREYLKNRGALGYYVTIFKLSSHTLHASDFDTYVVIGGETVGNSYNIGTTFTTSDVSPYLGTGTVLLFLSCLYDVSRYFTLGRTQEVEEVQKRFIAARPDSQAPSDGPFGPPKTEGA